jgi:ABC-type microcin C transport system permease subunit YejB
MQRLEQVLVMSVGVPLALIVIAFAVSLLIEWLCWVASEDDGP